jgi:hypothetical protein
MPVGDRQPIEAAPNSGQELLLREAADNGGVIRISEWRPAHERKAANALVRIGMLSCGNLRGYGWHHVTEHGRQWLARNEQEPLQ